MTTVMNINANTYCALLVKCMIMLLLISLLSCGKGNNNKNISNDSTIINPDIRDRNNEMDGDDTRQPSQDQDSVNRVLNENGGKQPDTLPQGMK
jgi:hypothetical protein